MELEKRLENHKNFIQFISSISSVIVLIITFCTVYHATLRPEFELEYNTFEDFKKNNNLIHLKENQQVELDFYVDELNNETNLSLDEYIKTKDLKKDIKIYDAKDNNLRFRVGNNSKVSAENTKIFFAFNDMEIIKKKDDPNSEWRTLSDNNIDGYAKQLVWEDKNNMLYSKTKINLNYNFKDARIFGDNPYIIIQIVSKNSILQEYKIKLNLIY